ncbi:type II secretion system F family protein [Sediminivirga luteola]|jgi:tight adherence protein B|uniref:Membrane protein n=1 Tax=Sediminivirga luteola TaxID=1774748 RepID=A0A8J2TXP2_9MICO|nr:type II secretion system F family protein [Sediminivirga luteola]MCI2266053.1 type II secretion system F family protein [Sediminivirga luteola]GGA13440.1 membrane protein [Sediminivirga luteola]
MSPELLLLLLAGVLVVAVVGFLLFTAGSAEQAAIVRSESGGLRGSFRGAVIRPVDRAFQRLPLGRWLATSLTEANLRSVYAVEYALAGLLVVVLVFLIALTQITWFYAAALAFGVAWGMLIVLRKLRERQHRLFLAQLPELARILANATNAGLSIRTALKIAATELSDPAGRELALLNHELNIGTPIDVALERLEQRVPGRDLSVLVGTLVISQRSGGSLISALRGMAGALEDRKESAREVKTLMTQSSYTGYLVVGFGVGIVLMLNAISPGLLYDLTSTVLGQIGLVFTAVCYLIGLVLIGRMTRVKI